jgi:hypothetical protein
MLLDNSCVGGARLVELSNGDGGPCVGGGKATKSDSTMTSVHTFFKRQKEHGLISVLSADCYRLDLECVDLRGHMRREEVLRLSLRLSGLYGYLPYRYSLVNRCLLLINSRMSIASLGP